MIIPRYIIDNLPAQVKIPFLHWTEYMESNLSFNLADSEIHTKGHSERVLLYALLIGEKMAEQSIHNAAFFWKVKFSSSTSTYGMSTI